MKQLILFIALFPVCSSYASDNGLDSLVKKVLVNYSKQKELQYYMSMKRFDSTRKRKIGEVNIAVKFKSPDYHIKYDNQLEKYYRNNNYYEINHIDSIIYVVTNTSVDPKKLDVSNYLKEMEELELEYEIEYENKKTVKIKMKDEKDIPEFYMSMIIDKETLLIVQSQFTKKENILGDMILYFYQMDFSGYKTNQIEYVDATEIENAVAKREYKLNSKYKRYKIEYKN